MKKLLKVAALFVTMALTACGGGKGGNTAGGNTSSRHRHSAAPDAVWQKDETTHWHNCVEGDGGKVDSASHTFEADTADPANRASTCSVAGIKVEVCSVCGYRREVSLDKAPHNYVEKADDPAAKEATCSEPGLKVEICSECQDRRETPLYAAHDLHDFEYDHEQAADEVTVTVQKCSKDNYYEIAFNAYDEKAVASNASDIHSSSKYVKLSKQVAADGTGSASTIEWKFYSPVALTGRFWLGITGNTSNLYNRASGEGDQALFYTHNDPTTEINTWKNKVELNGDEIDFDNATYNVEGEDIEYKKLVYADFGELSGSTSGTPISVPMPEVEIIQGVNTLKMTRLTGYAFNMHTITFKANLD